MNNAILSGRLASEPQVQYSNNGKAVTRFTLAVDKMKKEDGADFIRIVTFDKVAEVCGKHLVKGQKVSVIGRINTGSYKDKEGRTIYTTDIVASSVEFGDKPKEPQEAKGFNEIDEELPF